MKKLSLITVLMVGFVAAGCGSDDSTSSSSTVSSVSLTSLPSASGMVSTSSSILGGNLAVTGTPPNLVEIGTDAGGSTLSVDQVFFNGLLATISTPATQAQAQAFFEGEGSCYMAQSVGESLGRMLQAAGTQCYMKGIESAASGITVANGGSQTGLFEQAAAAKTVKINISGEAGEGGGGGPETVYIRVNGTDTTTTDVYSLDLWFCNSSGTVTGTEAISVTKSTGVLTSTNSHVESEGNGQETITAFLKQNADGTLSYDPAKERTATAQWDSSTFGTYKGQITITADNKIYAKRYNSFNSGGFSGTDKNYSVSSFAGTGMSSLKFNEAAFKGTNVFNGGSGNETHSYSGATEWVTDHYAATSSSTLSSEIESVDLSTDTFYNATALSLNFSAYSCTATADVEVTMDFNDSVIQSLAQSCEADRYDAYSLCNSDTVTAARNKAFGATGIGE